MPQVRIRPTLTIDTTELTRQKELLAEVAQSLVYDTPFIIAPDHIDAILGLESLCDALTDCIADQSSADCAEEQRRDEKHGLYSAHEDQSN